MNDAETDLHCQPWRAHDELPEAVVGYGTAEIGYLLSCHAGPQINQTSHMLAYERLDEYLTWAGASSLLARGQAHLTNTDLELVGPASLLEYVFALASRWTRIGLHDSDTTGIDALVYIQAPHQAVLLQPRAVDTWWAVFTRAQTAASALLHPVIANHTVTYPNGTAFIDTKTLETNDTCFVRPHGELWEWVNVTGPATDIFILTTPQLNQRIDAILET